MTFIVVMEFIHLRVGERERRRRKRGKKKMDIDRQTEWKDDTEREDSTDRGIERDGGK